MSAKIDRTHGFGGSATSTLINDIFKSSLSNEHLDQLSDSAVVPGSGRLALSTDSFVIRPLFFPGGNIGSLAVCGTVNDLLVSGACPRYLTAGFILEEGLDMEALEKIVHSMAETAKEAGVMVVTGDTKVVEPADPKAPGLMINTSGVGFLGDSTEISASLIGPDDTVIVSGTLGDHQAAILSSRLSIKNNISSDAAPLNEMITTLMKSGVQIHAMRDITRGGLATILNEFASAASCHISIEESAVPVSGEVSSFCRLLGLDPLYMGNEGKCAFVVSGEDAERALDTIKGCRFGENAAIIGTVKTGKSLVTLHTSIGGTKTLEPLTTEGLPRIC